MSSLFDSKAAEWDNNPTRAEMSRTIACAIQNGIPLSDTMSAMEFGCGTGLISRELLPFLQSITAIDLSQGMIDQLQQRIHDGQLEKISARCLDIIEEPLAEQFDLIFSGMALHHIEDTQKTLDTLLAHLNPGGWISIADLDTEDGSFHQDFEGFIHHGFDREELSRELQNRGCEIVAVTTAHVIEKANRTYPVFLIIARKI